MQEYSTHVVAQEVALDLGGGGARPQASHHCYQLLGFDLAFPLAVVQRETLLKLCGHMNTLHTCPHCCFVSASVMWTERDHLLGEGG